MATAIKKSPLLEGLYWAGFIVFLTSIVFSWRAVTSVSLCLVILLGVAERSFIFRRGRKGGTEGAKRSFSPDGLFVIAAFGYLLIQVLMTLVSNDPTLQQLQTKAAVPAIPLAIYLSSFINTERGAVLFHALAILLILAFFYCLTVAGINFNGGNREFFYHNLVSPIRGHAVYLSIYTFIALVFLMESLRQRRWVVPKNIHLLMTALLVIFLILLASKLVIAFFLFYLLYFIYALFKKHKRRKQFGFLLLLLAFVNGVLLFSSDNPVKERFTDLGGRIGAGEKNDPSQYLNGIQFRLLQWKLVPGILTEKSCWLTGVGISRGQSELNRKYRERNMYLGDGKEDKGYRQYNAHNQFLQDLLQTGLPGLIGFMLMCLAMTALWFRKRSMAVLLTVSLILVYAFVESLLETQFGIVIFCFFPLLSYLSIPNKPSRKTTPLNIEH